MYLLKLLYNNEIEKKKDQSDHAIINGLHHNLASSCSSAIHLALQTHTI